MAAAEEERSLTPALLGQLQAGLPLITGASKARVFREVTGDGEKKDTGKMVLVLTGGILNLVAVLLPLLLRGALYLPASLLLATAGSVLLFLSGSRKGKKKEENATLQTAVEIDPERVLSIYQSMLITADRIAGEVEGEEKEERKNPREEEALSPELLELFSSLLAARCSGDGTFCLDSLQEVEYFLHRQGIEVVPWEQGERGDFDLMPSRASGTIRPALKKNGELLMRGIAADREVE